MLDTEIFEFLEFLGLGQLKLFGFLSVPQVRARGLLARPFFPCSGYVSSHLILQSPNQAWQNSETQPSVAFLTSRVSSHKQSSKKSTCFAQLHKEEEEIVAVVVATAIMVVEITILLKIASYNSRGTGLNFLQREPRIGSHRLF